MSTRVQVILDEAEATRFRARARREGKSLSAWLRDAGRRALEAGERGGLLADGGALREFFGECDRREAATREPEWEEHKRVLADSYRSGERP